MHLKQRWYSHAQSKKNRVSYVLFLLFLVTVPLRAQYNNYKVPEYSGEIMNYTLKYGMFTIGNAKLKFTESEACDGAFILAEAKSSGLVKFFKDIHYKFESCMDTNTGLPITDSRKIVEDEFTDINTVEYFHNIREDSTVVYSKETDSLVVPKNILDILTGFYFFRQNCIHDKTPIGHVDTISTFFFETVWDLIILYAGKETVETEFGEIECYKLMPETQVGRYFQTNKDMSLWVTADGRLIPVKIEVRLRIGTLNTDIVSYKSPEDK